MDAIGTLTGLATHKLSLGWIAAGVVLIALSALGPQSAFVFVLFGAGMLVLGVIGKTIAKCPNCADPIDISDRIGACGRCLLYFARDGRQIAELCEDAQGEFGAPLQEVFSTPSVCCECGAPATRTLGVSGTTNPRPRSIVVVNWTEFNERTVRLPYCAAHNNGARITGPASRPKDYVSLILIVKSYAFHRQYIQANRMGAFAQEDFERILQ